MKNPNDTMCHILKLPFVNILVCIVVISVIASVVVGTHPWIRMKLPISYEKYFIHRL
jgi:hypothetical protein